MLVPYKWLKDYVDIDLPVKELSERMTMSGSKVELWSCDADTIKNIIWGRVISVDRHPNAERLNVCKVDAGEKTLQIITNAANLYPGATVPVCIDGAVLADGTEIHPTVMRGVESDGMFCSFAELGMTQNDVPYADPKGILIYPGEVKLGTSVLNTFGLDDTKIEFEITPNRPDCLCVLGLAREAGATFKKEVKYPRPKIGNTVGDIKDLLEVEITSSELCPRYSAAAVKDITIAPSPEWMRERLRNAGLRPINNIVDITNFVMLEYGQPMHAFDYSCIRDGKIIVRSSLPGETVTTLDGIERPIPDGTILITDPQGPIGIAGIMGGQNSEITENTKTVIFESANFSGPAIRRSTAKIGFRTDASSRFEKGLDSENTMPALMRALELVEMIGAGKVVGGFIDCHPSPKTPRKITLEPERTCRFLGTDIAEAEMKEILLSLGFEVSGNEITVPSWRDDVTGFADIAEEIARIHGYDLIPPTLVSGRVTEGGLNPRQKFEAGLLNASVVSGYSEIRTWSFMGKRDLDLCDVPEDHLLRKALTIMNPLGEDQKMMRTSLIPSMIASLATNFSFRTPVCRLIEIEPIYVPVIENGEARNDLQPFERKDMVLGGFGNFDFYALRADLERILSSEKISDISLVPVKDDFFFHPGRCADIYSGSRLIGRMGQINPRIAANYQIDTEIYAAVLHVDELAECVEKNVSFSPLPRFPATGRDMAVTVDESVNIMDLIKVIRESVGELLEDCRLFDIYRGPQIPENKKSVAVSLSLRSPDHTLTDDEADKAVKASLESIKERFSAVIRQ